MLFSERKGKRSCKWLPVSIHCLGKLLRKERESVHVGKAVWPEEGGRAINKRAVLKDNILQRAKTDWHANRWVWVGERWRKQMQFPRDKQSPWGQLPVKGAGRHWQGQISKNGSGGTATINPACAPSWIFSILPEEQAAWSSCASAGPWHNLSRESALLLTPFRWVQRGKGSFTAAETSQLAPLLSLLSSLLRASDLQRRCWGQSGTGSRGATGTSLSRGWRSRSTASSPKLFLSPNPLKSNFCNHPWVYKHYLYSIFKIKLC